MWRKLTRREFYKSAVVLHRTRETLNVPIDRLLRLVAAPKGSGRCPPELEIVLTTNYDFELISVRSMNWLGVDRYTILRPPSDFKWKGGLPKLLLINQYLSNGPLRSKYLLYFDVADAILLQSPERAIGLLEASGADLLFSNTDIDKDRFLIPDESAVNDRHAESAGFGPGTMRYLNAGVFIGRTEYVAKVARELCEGMTFESCATRLSVKSLDQAKKRGEIIDIAAALTNLDNDQTYLRRMMAREHPRMKVDYRSELAIR